MIIKNLRLQNAWSQEKLAQLVTHTGIRTSLSLFMLHFQ